MAITSINALLEQYSTLTTGVPTVVLNSGFTFREYDCLDNARPVPKLLDFAMIDVNVPASSRSHG